MGDGTTALLIGSVSQIQGPKSTSVQRGLKCSLIHTQSLYEAHRGQSVRWDILSLRIATKLKQSAGAAQQLEEEEVGAQAS